jgi:hypothetical protein
MGARGRSLVRPGRSREPESLGVRSARPPGEERVLALQASAGNAAVATLMRDTAVAAPAGSRRAFEQTMRSRFGVARVRAGTEADQVADMRRFTPTADPSPTSISEWTAWDPAATSDLYADITAGFEATTRALGGIPEVTEIRFLDSDNENVGGTAERRQRHGANYSGGILSIFKRVETAPWALPEGASRPGRPAAVTYGSGSENRRRIIVHELGHGIAERFGTPGRSGAEEGLFAAFNRAAGWVGGHIEQDGTTLTQTNWNDAWPEQPVSRYSLSNPGEDFAETIMAYVERPEVLRARSPGRFAFVDSRRSTWGLTTAHSDMTPRQHDPRGESVPETEGRREPAGAVETGAPARVLALQRSAGNQAVQRLLQRQGPTVAPPKPAPSPPAPTQVSTEISDPPYGWWAKYEVTFVGAECRLNVKVRLVAGAGVSAADVTRVQAQTSEAFTRIWDRRFVITDTTAHKHHALRVGVTFVTSGEHLAVNLHAGSGHANLSNWYVDGAANSRAHELGHQLGLKDEYISATAPSRATPTSPGSSRTTRSWAPTTRKEPRSPRPSHATPRRWAVTWPRPPAGGSSAHVRRSTCT